MANLIRRFTDSALFLFMMSTGASAAQWTFMIYMDADNNLEEVAVDDFLEMAGVGSDTNVNIVVQFDRIDGHDTRFGDWTDCKRYLVTPGMTPVPGSALLDLGEVDMGDTATLTSSGRPPGGRPGTWSTGPGPSSTISSSGMKRSFPDPGILIPRALTVALLNNI